MSQHIVTLKKKKSLFDGV